MKVFYFLLGIFFGVQFIQSALLLGTSEFNLIFSFTLLLLTCLMGFLIYGNQKNSKTQTLTRYARKPEKTGHDETLPISISGESYYQETLIELFGKPDVEGHNIASTALLVREPNNLHDSNAIKCLINEKLVGHVNRDDAEVISNNMDSSNLVQINVHCEIKGGWHRTKQDSGMYGVTVYVPNRLLE